MNLITKNFSINLILINLLLLFCCQSGWAQRSRSEVPKCNDKCRKCKEKLNPYENRCENTISLKGIELKGITEEAIHCCEYRMRWHCLFTYGISICTEDEMKDLKKFTEYDVGNVVGTMCSDVKYGEGFCRSRSSPSTEANVIMSSVPPSVILIIWLAFELNCY